MPFLTAGAGKEKERNREQELGACGAPEVHMGLDSEPCTLVEPLTDPTQPGGFESQVHNS